MKGFLKNACLEILLMGHHLVSLISHNHHLANYGTCFGLLENAVTEHGVTVSWICTNMSSKTLIKHLHFAHLHYKPIYIKVQINFQASVIFG